MVAQIEIVKRNQRNKNKENINMIGKTTNTYFLLGLR